MLFFCTYCFEPNRSYEGQTINLCRGCYTKITSCVQGKSKGQKYPFYSIFKYEREIRELILRVKVKNDLQALQVLVGLALNDHKLQSLVADCDVVMPAPSSLWGRMRGKVDLAYFLCHGISRYFSRPLLSAPFALYWQSQKRALVPTSERRQQHSPVIPSQKKSPSKTLLIVDDVMTTGFTLHSVAERCAYANIQLFTLAAK